MANDKRAYIEFPCQVVPADSVRFEEWPEDGDVYVSVREDGEERHGTFFSPRQRAKLLAWLQERAPEPESPDPDPWTEGVL